MEFSGLTRIPQVALRIAQATILAARLPKPELLSKKYCCKPANATSARVVLAGGFVAAAAANSAAQRCDMNEDRNQSMDFHSNVLLHPISF